MLSDEILRMPLQMLQEKMRFENDLFVIRQKQGAGWEELHNIKERIEQLHAVIIQKTGGTDVEELN